MIRGDKSALNPLRVAGGKYDKMNERGNEKIKK